MSLLTLERSSPSPHESENEDLLSNSSYEGFVARDHYALCLSPRPFTSLGPGRSGDTLRIFSHLKKLVKMLRIQDKLRMAVELENNGLRKVTKYLVIITTSGHVDTEETVVLGTEQEGSTIRICLVLPLWRDTGIKLDGDGGFSVHTGDRHHFFKPSSVQSMWAALQMMYKATNDAQSNNYYVGGLSHTWMTFYTSMLTTDGMILNEWNLMEDVESFRPDYGSDVTNWSDERIALEKVLTTKLREVMLHQDLEEVTCKQLRLLLEEQMSMDLKDYREFLDQQMLRILGQMERPSQIFDYLYLGSEWNASNLQELKEIGVKYILNISREIDNFYPEEFKYLNIRLYDLPNSELMKHWDRTYTFLKEAKASGKKVLVHCKMGISRSAATVVAYTMKEYKMSLEDAVQHVKSKRSIVNPNDGFMNQLKAYEGILKARHNELWGKMAPSRPHPVALYRARSRSEPNIPELFTKEEDDTELQFLGEEGGGPDIFHTSCNHLDRQHLTADQKQNGSTPPRHIASQSYSHFPPQSTPIDKTENIRNFLASLPNVTVEDDAGFNENLCGTSESGSGYSSPVSSPTDDDHHLHGRYKLVKEIKREHKGMSSASEPPSQGAGEVQQGRGGSEEDTDMGIMMKELSSEEQKTLLVASDAPVNLENRATSSSHKTSKQEQQEREKGTTTTTTADTERVQPMAQIPVFHSIPKPLRSTSLPRNIAPQYHHHPHPPPADHSTTPSDSLVAEHGSTTNASEIPSESNYDPSLSPSEQSIQQRAASKGAEGGLMDTSSPIIELPQIHSVPERIKEIEEMHSLKSTSKSPTVCDNTLVSSGSEKKDDGIAAAASVLPMETEAPLAGRNEEDRNVVGDNDAASLTRASSGHSISSCSAGDEELKHLTLMEEDISSKTPPPAAPPTTLHAVMTTRHSSLSPSPLPLSRQGVALGSDDHSARASSCVHLSEPTRTSAVVIEEVSQLTQQLGSGAVKARVMDIEERNRDEKSASSDELSVRRQSPPYQPRSSSSSEVVVPHTGPVYEARDLKQIVSLQQQQQRRSSSEVIQEKKLSLQDLHNRRESTPPAFLSAWNTLVDEVPTAPVQDLKKKFEDSDSVSVSSSVGSGASAGPRTHHVATKIRTSSSKLRRTQSLKDMEFPATKIRYRARRNKAKVPSNSAGVRTSSPFL